MSSSDDGPTVGYSPRAGTEGDPTGTHPIADRYGGRIRARWDELKGDVRRRIEGKDPDGFTNTSIADETAIAAFVGWLLTKINKRVLTVISPTRNPFIQAAYERGVRNALAELRAAPGFDLNGPDVPEARKMADGGEPGDVAQSVVRRGGSDHSSGRLAKLKRRSFRELKEIAKAVVDAVRSRLFGRSSEQDDGLTNRSKVAGAVNDRIEHVGKYRSTLLARTETVRAHSEGAITTAERTSVRAVTIRVEWITAGDIRVCPVCSALEGTKYRTAEVRTGTFSYEAGPTEPPSLTGIYPVMPPAHPNCRCAIIPSIPVTASQPQPYGGMGSAGAGT